jgi:hypothetical protein
MPQPPPKTHTVRHSSIHGRGVFASSDRGTQIISTKTAHVMDKPSPGRTAIPTIPHTVLFEIDDGVIKAHVRSNAAAGSIIRVRCCDA